jgi:hypothetical protein
MRLIVGVLAPTDRLLALAVELNATAANEAAMPAAITSVLVISISMSLDGAPV